MTIILSLSAQNLRLSVNNIVVKFGEIYLTRTPPFGVVKVLIFVLVLFSGIVLVTPCVATIDHVKASSSHLPITQQCRKWTVCSQP